MYYLKTLRKGISEAALAAGKPQWETIKVEDADVDTYLNNDQNDVWEHCSETDYQEIEAQVAAYQKYVEENGDPDAPSEEEKLEDHVVTQEDLDNNPELVTEGVSVGDTIQVAVSEDESVEGEEAGEESEESEASEEVEDAESDEEESEEEAA